MTREEFIKQFNRYKKYRGERSKFGKNVKTDNGKYSLYWSVTPQSSTFTQIGSKVYLKGSKGNYNLLGNIEFIFIVDYYSNTVSVDSIISLNLNTVDNEVFSSIDAKLRGLGYSLDTPVKDKYSKVEYKKILTNVKDFEEYTFSLENLSTYFIDYMFLVKQKEEV